MKFDQNSEFQLLVYCPYTKRYAEQRIKHSSPLIALDPYACIMGAFCDFGTCEWCDKVQERIYFKSGLCSPDKIRISEKRICYVLEKYSSPRVVSTERKIELIHEAADTICGVLEIERKGNG